MLKDLYNFLARFKKQKIGTSKLTLGELSSWCEDNSKVPFQKKEAVKPALKIKKNKFQLHQGS